MSNEFKIDEAGEGYEYTDSVGDSLWIFKSSLGGPGEDLYVGAAECDGSSRAAYANGKALCGAIAKALGFKVRFEDELHQVELPVERSAIEIQDAINETVAKLGEAMKPAKPESPWLEVVPRYRAIRVTEDVVRDQTWNRHTRLRPKYHEYTGEPLGFEHGEDEVKLIPVGDVAIIAPDGAITSCWAEYLDNEYRVVGA